MFPLKMVIFHSFWYVFPIKNGDFPWFLVCFWYVYQAGKISPFQVELSSFPSRRRHLEAFAVGLAAARRAAGGVHGAAVEGDFLRVLLILPGLVNIPKTTENHHF